MSEFWENVKEKLTENNSLLAKIILGIIAVVVVAVIVVNIFGGAQYKVLEKATVTAISADELENGDYKVRDSFSESFYSTKEDKKMINKVKVIDNYDEYMKFYDEYHDIVQTYPADREKTDAQLYFDNGYVAAVVSVTDLFDPTKKVLATNTYTDADNNIIIGVGQEDRSSAYAYSLDPGTECKQIYTTIFMNGTDVENANSITIAVEK